MGSDQSGGFLGPLLLMIPLWILSSSSSSQATAYKFYVGGKDGWVVKPSEDYDHWAQRNRFQVNDTLYFKYKKGSDSVLVVKKEDYDSCNTLNPTQKMDDGDSTFHFNDSGPFFFISGNVGNCKNGQKLVVVVMAVRHKPHQSPTPSPAPSTATPPSVAPSTGTGETPGSSGPAPQTRIDESGLYPPSPSPSENSGSTRFSGSVGVALGVSVGAAFIFSGFAELVLLVNGPYGG